MPNPVEKNNAARKKQFKIFAVAILMILALILIHAVIGHHSTQKKSSETVKEKADISSSLPNNMAESGMTKILTDTTDSLKAFKTDIGQKFKTINDSIVSINEHLKKTDLKQTQLENAIQTIPSQQNRTVDAKTIKNNPQEDANNRSVLTSVQKPLLSIHAQQFIDAPKPIQNKITNHVTAGTYARAVLLSGADTNAGVNSQTNSIPVNLRFVSQGTLPNGYHSSLKGCFALAAARGSVSSERGEIRLNRLSCIRDGHVLDIAVQGIVVDQSGMNGLRGHLVIRNGSMLWNAGVAGFFSGVGQGLSSSLTTQSISPLGTTNALPSSDVFKYGAYTGANNALNKLADYYIKMASLYHPVIEIHPGAIVDVLFLKSFSLEVKQTKDAKTTSPTIAAHHYSTDGQMQNQVNALMDRVKTQQVKTNQILKAAQGKGLGEKMEVSA